MDHGHLPPKGVGTCQTGAVRSSSTGSPVPSPTQVPVEGEIRLGQFLKLCGAAESGADARRLLEEGEVQVNGEPEARRGRQLVTGDLVVVEIPTGAESYLVG